MKCLARHLPGVLARPLFGDRERWGRTPIADDPDWLTWERHSVELYESTQRDRRGGLVNDSGYRIMREIDLAGATVVEIGPGQLDHMRHWKGRPDRFVLLDRREEMLSASAATLAREGVPSKSILLAGDSPLLPLPDACADIVLSFYSLEHLHPLDSYLAELQRILKPGGRLAGAIPAEGGLAWGLGRFLTTRREFRRSVGLDYDKVICWEHPNFADQVMNSLHRRFRPRHLSFWPLAVPVPDVNLIIRFIVEKRDPPAA
ncbi:class I SAM-dependent methyltransferase [Oceanibacterium hippocampi]|uniref:Methyltransferase type 11 domain-containing protein n=1 Tax=Oceanibacterium hippocampi TaxID=745714 RepID=A0A1Y5S045_9PROT|nr:class I SAM-dependent methyltransferase [Oceanibacterium hippocampi]SLN29686.1 hypothetical protein OCH7691_01025 [Oceanibacterium hippocampi]